MSTFTLAPDGRRWFDGFRVGDRVAFYDRPGTITSHTPERAEGDPDWEPEFWDVRLDDGSTSAGYVNEFDFLGVAGMPG